MLGSVGLIGPCQLASASLCPINEPSKFSSGMHPATLASLDLEAQVPCQPGSTSAQVAMNLSNCYTLPWNSLTDCNDPTASSSTPKPQQQVQQMEHHQQQPLCNQQFLPDDGGYLSLPYMYGGSSLGAGHNEYSPTSSDAAGETAAGSPARQPACGSSNGSTFCNLTPSTAATPVPDGSAAALTTTSATALAGDLRLPYVLGSGTQPSRGNGGGVVGSTGPPLTLQELLMQQQQMQQLQQQQVQLQQQRQQLLQQQQQEQLDQQRLEMTASALMARTTSSEGFVPALDLGLCCTNSGGGGSLVTAADASASQCPADSSVWDLNMSAALPTLSATGIALSAAAAAAAGSGGGCGLAGGVAGLVGLKRALEEEQQLSPYSSPAGAGLSGCSSIFPVAPGGGAGGGHTSTKNRDAQRRFRQRQREAFAALEARVRAQELQLQSLYREKRMVEQHNEVLLKQLHAYEQSAAVQQQKRH